MERAQERRLEEMDAIWMKKLNHRFGDDGEFWMLYDGLRSKFDILDRTRLFDHEWTVVQQWTGVNVSWVTGYLNTKFQARSRRSARPYRRTLLQRLRGPVYFRRVLPAPRSGGQSRRPHRAGVRRLVRQPLHQRRGRSQAGLLRGAAKDCGGQESR